MIYSMNDDMNISDGLPFQYLFHFSHGNSIMVSNFSNNKHWFPSHFMVSTGILLDFKSEFFEG